MSTTAIQQVVQELRDLPESDQNLVLGFLQGLKHKRNPSPVVAPRRSRNPALKLIDGALVFAGELGGPQTDWLQVVRAERETEIIGLTSNAAEPK
jgi:hypothetical protein